MSEIAAADPTGAGGHTLARMFAQLRRVAHAPVVLRRMRVVNAPAHFAINQWRHSAEIRSYGIRGSHVSIALRHATSDMAAFNEVFVNREYRPPPDLADVVASFRAPRVVDLGANVGSYALWAFTCNPASHVVSVEPDPDSVSVARIAQRLNPAVDWEVIEAAAATENGHVGFVSGRGTASRVADPGEEPVITVATIDALPLLADCDVAKIDIEGGEWPILADPRLKTCGVQVLAVEYHARHGLDVETAVTLLQSAGFTTHPPIVKSSTMGLVWAHR